MTNQHHQNIRDSCLGTLYNHGSTNPHDTALIIKQEMELGARLGETEGMLNFGLASVTGHSLAFYSVTKTGFYE